VANVQFKWKKVPEGHKYRLTIRPATGEAIVIETDKDQASKQLTDGNYVWSVRALGEERDECEGRESEMRSLTVGTPCNQPAVTIAPAVQQLANGQRASLVATVTGTAPVTVQWFEGPVGDRSKPVGTGLTFRSPALVKNTSYWCEATNGCGKASSNAASASVADACTPPAVTAEPPNKSIAANSSATLNVSASGTQPLTYQWYAGNAGDRSKPVGSNSSTLNTGNLTRTTSYWVSITNNCGSASSRTAIVTVTEPCTPPSITSEPARKTINPNQTTTLAVAASGTEPFTYQWYRGAAGDRSTPVGTNSASYKTDKLTTTTNYWVEITNRCGSAISTTATVRVEEQNSTCHAMVDVPAISAVASIASGLSYVVTWSEVENATEYEIEEAPNASFENATSQRTSGLFASFLHETTNTLSLFYRVRAINGCDGSMTPFSTPARVAIVAPPPADSAAATDVVAPIGTRDRVKTTVTVHLDPSAATFTALTSESWATVFPWTGAVPPDGRVQFTISADPTRLSHGTSRVSLRVTTSAASVHGLQTNGNSTVVVPISVSLVTPVMPAAPANGGEVWVIPAVAHADGNNSKWQSDVRIAHTYAAPVRYRLTFTPSGADLSSAVQTEITVASGETVALDDILGHWFGAGIAASGSTGVLEIRTLNAALGTGRTLATSRLFNTTPDGSFGQFIAAVPHSKFLASAGRQTLVALSQSSRFRTNVGLVEGSGFPANVQLDAFDGNGAKLLSTTLALKAGEHRQIGSLLTANGVDATHARVDVKLLSPVGSVYSYASVIDNTTGDPSFVPPADADLIEGQKFTIAGVANLDTGSGKWQTDMQLFNGSASSVHASLDFFAQGQSVPTATRELDIAGGAMLTLEDVAPSLFGLSGVGGAIRIRTDGPSALIPTARTYHKRDGETYGQFISAITDSDTTFAGSAPLQILQAEESLRFRTNVGLTEVSGQPATVEVTAALPGQKQITATRVELQPNEFRQLNSILHSMDADDAYNARITVSVVGGAGRVAAYGSVIDNYTQDPTYVKAQ
jgi:hypothetical protein